jgi:hypothetical protein
MPWLSQNVDVSGAVCPEPQRQESAVYSRRLPQQDDSDTIICPDSHNIRQARRDSQLVIPVGSPSHDGSVACECKAVLTSCAPGSTIIGSAPLLSLL